MFICLLSNVTEPHGMQLDFEDDPDSDEEEAGSEETEETDDSESEAFEDAMEKLNISA